MRIKTRLAVGLLVSLLTTTAVHADQAWADFNPATGEIIGQTVNQYRTAATLAYSPNQIMAASMNQAPNNSQNQTGRSALPKTELSSFVRDSGMRDDIYGMEGQVANQKYSSIDSGINGRSATGLSTGHRADVPDIWGYLH